MKKSSQKSSISELVQSAIMQPQEKMQEVAKSSKQLFVGIPKEIAFQEKRVPLVPESVALLVNNGHQVLIEANAGEHANYSDTDYSEAGAQIAYSTEAVYKADLILKIEPPSMKEVELMQNNQTLFSILLISMQPKDFIKNMSKKRITALAYEYLKDETSIRPVIQAMGEIVGSTSILIASEYLSNSTSGKGTLLGGVIGIPPAEVVILGAGTVGESAARTAMGLGAKVKVFDDSLFRLRKLRDKLGTNVYTSTISPKTLLDALKRADVAIGATFSRRGRTPCLVTEEMVSAMNYGSVIVDVSIDQGGCFETSEVTTHTDPVFKKYGVIHYCVPNIASRVSRTASQALSNIFTPILLAIGEESGFDEMLWTDKHVRDGVYLYKGTVTNQFVSDICQLPFRDLDLLMASRF
ncbi:MAG: alanine dehydrogenase [Bacteroidia bacterium]|nr:alanine dehydrogenase [Bacteroidia bacterium]